MKQEKPAHYPKNAEDGTLPVGTMPLPMTLSVRARRAERRRARGKRGRWLNAEPRRLSGSKGRGR